MRKKLQAIKTELRWKRHHPLGEVGRWLGQVVRGWLRYYAVPTNSQRLRKATSELSF